MTRRALIKAFTRLVEPELLALGFTGAEGHFIRRTPDGVAQVIELQHSIYGGRVTANLGLDLEGLRPLVRWIAPPALGPHAHDASRWIRIGMVRPERADCWWAFDPASSAECAHAAKSCGRALLDHGLPWLEAESSGEAFLGYARTRVERSTSPARPEGGYVELRLMAAVLARLGEHGEASRWVARAARAWEDERRRLEEARAHYLERHGDGRALPGVPDAQGELEELVSRTVRTRPASEPWLAPTEPSAPAAPEDLGDATVPSPPAHGFADASEDGPTEDLVGETRPSRPATGRRKRPVRAAKPAGLRRPRTR